MNDDNRNFGGDISGFDSFEPENNVLNELPKTPSQNVSEQTGTDFVLINDELEKEEESLESSFTPKSHSFFPSGNYGDGSENTEYEPYAVYRPARKPKEQKPIKEKREKKSLSVPLPIFVIAIILSALIGAGSFFISDVLTTDAENNTSVLEEAKENNTTTNINISGSIEMLAQTAAAKASPSVVGIRSSFAVYNFFGGTSDSSGEGSGVIYKENGYIITNYHVIGDAVEYSDGTPDIKVFLSNDTEKSYAASVVGYNIAYDLAVLKIEATGLPAIELGNSDDVTVGQYVTAIGNPGGLEFMGSVSFGIVSGINRNITVENMGTMSLIQTDAAINPGNSGGALVNTEGKLIAVPSVKLVDESVEGMGFAIPVNTVVSVVEKIITHENSGASYTGITVSTRYSSQILGQLGFPAGAVVQSVVEGSPADEAGIKRGDIITKFGEMTITDYSMLPSAISAHYPGETVEVTIYRSKETKTVSLTIGSNTQ